MKKDDFEKIIDKILADKNLSEEEKTDKIFAFALMTWKEDIKNWYCNENT